MLWARMNHGEPAPRDVAPRALASLHVLVVDDNADAADLVALLLGVRGHTTEVAYGSTDALERARARCPDVAILDLGMPGLDGIALARIFREDPGLRSVHLIALTGWGTPADRARTHAAGFEAHLVKPAGHEELDGALRLVASSRPAR